MHKARLIQVMLWFAVFVWLFFLMYLTLQNGTSSTETSTKIAKVIYKLLVKMRVNVMYMELHMALRIAAHFVIFYVFGVLIESAILTNSKKAGFWEAVIPILFICVTISIISEVVKVWVPGRHLNWNEVLQDRFAACLVHMVYT